MGSGSALMIICFPGHILPYIPCLSSARRATSVSDILKIFGSNDHLLYALRPAREGHLYAGVPGMAMSAAGDGCFYLC